MKVWDPDSEAHKPYESKHPPISWTEILHYGLLVLILLILQLV